MNSQTESLSASANCLYIKSWFKDTFFKLFYLNPYSFTFLCFFFLLLVEGVVPVLSPLLNAIFKV